MAGDFVLFSCFKRKLYLSLDFPSLWSKCRGFEHRRNAQEFSQLPHSSNWRMALPPFFQFFFFSPKESVASPVPSLFFFWKYWMWFEFVFWFSCHSPDCETPLSRRYYFKLAQTFWPQLFRPKVDPWPKVKSCKFVQSYVRSNDELDTGDFLLDTWK